MASSLAPSLEGEGFAGKVSAAVDNLEGKVKASVGDDSAAAPSVAVGGEVPSVEIEGGAAALELGGDAVGALDPSVPTKDAGGASVTTPGSAGSRKGTGRRFSFGKMFGSNRRVRGGGV